MNNIDKREKYLKLIMVMPSKVAIVIQKQIQIMRTNNRINKYWLS